MIGGLLRGLNWTALLAVAVLMWVLSPIAATARRVTSGHPAKMFRVGWFAMRLGPLNPHHKQLGMGCAKGKWSATHLFGRLYLVNVPTPVKANFHRQPRWLTSFRQMTSTARRRQQLALTT